MGRPIRSHAARSSDPRTMTVGELQIGDILRGSRVKYIKPQKRGSRNGYRITLANFASSWGQHGTCVMDLQFQRP